MHTFLDPSVESQFRIIFKSCNFLFGTTTTPSITFSNSHFFSGQSRHASSSLIVLYLWLGAKRLTTHAATASTAALLPPLCCHRCGCTAAAAVAATLPPPMKPHCHCCRCLQLPLFSLLLPSLSSLTFPSPLPLPLLVDC